MQKVFVSYKHDDIDAFNDIKSLNQNPNNEVKFIDWSLSEPVYNSYGHVNRRPPFDPYSNSVNNKIITLLEQADKMLVLIGQNTHSSLWVEWEVKTFRKHHNDRDILLMSIKGANHDGIPHAAIGLEVHPWDTYILNKFVKR